MFALTITTPVIDFDEDDRKWKQYLHMLQCLIAPVFFVMGAGGTLGCTSEACFWHPPSL